MTFWISLLSALHDIMCDFIPPCFLFLFLDTQHALWLLIVGKTHGLRVSTYPIAAVDLKYNRYFEPKYFTKCETKYR